MKGTLATTLATMTLVIATASPAHANRYDFNLAALIGDQGRADRSGFEGLARDLGLAFQTRFGSPASSYGSAGFDVGYTLAITGIDQSATQWSQPVVNDAGSVLLLSQVSVQKGLPYSFGLNATFSRLHDSDLWGFDMGAKWAFVEGFEYFPDLALQIQGGTIVGNRDMSLFRASADLQISKSIPLGGLVRLTPYAAYSFVFIYAQSRVLGVFQPWEVEPTTDPLPEQFLPLHRGVVGVRATYAMFDVGFEAAIGQVTSFGIRIGLNF